MYLYYLTGYAYDSEFNIYQIHHLKHIWKANYVSSVLDVIKNASGYFINKVAAHHE